MSDASARVDVWLWSIRLFRTRSDATSACRGGKVRVNGRPAKAATQVSSGDRIEARIHAQDRVVEVRRPIQKRVGAPVAAECFADLAPPPPPTGRVDQSVPRRDRGSGRPTKRDRRRTDRLTGRDR